tara:strand:+ start:353 stop:805 length:453 start_codon:yes stop_codon:yes gene_type:complete
MAQRRDTKLEAEGAEFLVLGHLLLNQISTFKAYTNFPGYDLIATNAESNTSARVQVKSRWQTNWDGFIIKNFDCDFVVLVTLNRGYPIPKKSGDLGVRDPDFYIMPVEYVLKVRDPDNNWGKIVKSRLKDISHYQDRWDLIGEFLGVSSP